MAQQDTGLGWSADSAWLISAPGALTTLINLDGGTTFPGQPIPECNTGSAADVYNAGLTVGLNTNNGNTLKVAAGFNKSPVFVAGNSNYSLGGPKLIAVSLIGTGTVGIMKLFTPSGSQVSGGSGDLSSVLHHNNGLYYTMTNGFGNRPITEWYNLPQFSNIDDMMAALTIVSTQYYKLNAGYAVACLAIYNNENGRVVRTPVLISTEADAVALSTDGSTPCPYVMYSFVWEGRAFYMSMIPAAVFDGYSDSVVQVGDLRNFAVLFPQGVFNALAASDRAYITVTASTNPYPGESTEAGGGGSDPIDDEVGLEPVIFPSAIGTGFCRIYCPTAAQLQALSDYLWGPLFDLNNIKRLFADPMSCILGLSVVPLSITGNPDTVSVAGVSTGIQLNKLSAQHINVDLGSLQIVEKWGAYLDYEPYTKYSVYLPFIGYRTISADDVMGKWVHLSYDIDLLSGACVAKLVAGNTLLYQWAGSCAMQLPINASNWNSVISSTISTVGSMATAIASGGAAAPLISGSLASAGTLATQMKPNIERAGGVGGAAAFLSGRRAYMIRTYPELVNPGNQPHYIGYPSFITKSLSSLSGYNIVEEVHLEGIPATETELEEINTLLREGVIF